MISRSVRTSLVLYVAAVFYSGIAHAECEPAEFLPNALESGVLSDPVKIAFLLSSKKEHYEAALRVNPAAVLLDPSFGSLGFEQARQLAAREAQVRNFMHQPEYYRTFLGQRLPPQAARNYTQCITSQPSTPGIRIWLENQETNFAVLRITWFADGGEPVGAIITEVLDNMEIIGALPREWQSGVPQRVVLKRKGEGDATLILGIGNQLSSFILVAEPSLRPVISSPTASPKRIAVSSGGTSDRKSPFCQYRTAQDCIVPRPGGYLVPGTGTLSEARQAGGTRVGFKVVRDTPDQICVEVWASTTACEIEVSIEGKVAAIERLPADPGR